MNLEINDALIPGTKLKKSDMGNVTGLEFLSKVFFISEGVMLSQIREVSGIDGSTLQNWTKRGWVANARLKKYNIDQVAHILIINMLRSCIQLACSPQQMRQQCISSLMASSSHFPLFALDAVCPTYLFPRGKSSARHQDGITHPSIERKHYITLHLKISRAISSPTPFYIFHCTLYTSLFPLHLLHFYTANTLFPSAAVAMAITP